MYSLNLILWTVYNLVLLVHSTIHLYSGCKIIDKNVTGKHLDCAGNASVIPNLLLNVSDRNDVKELRLHMDSQKNNFIDVSNLKYFKNLTTFSLG